MHTCRQAVARARRGTNTHMTDGEQGTSLSLLAFRAQVAPSFVPPVVFFVSVQARDGRLISVSRLSSGAPCHREVAEGSCRLSGTLQAGGSGGFGAQDAVGYLRGVSSPGFLLKEPWGGRPKKYQDLRDDFPENSLQQASCCSRCDGVVEERQALLAIRVACDEPSCFSFPDVGWPSGHDRGRMSVALPPSCELCACASARTRQSRVHVCPRGLMRRADICGVDCKRGVSHRSEKEDDGSILCHVAPGRGDGITIQGRSKQCCMMCCMPHNINCVWPHVCFVVGAFRQAW